MFHEWLFLLRSVSDWWRIILRFTFKISAKRVRNSCTFLNLFSMRRESTYFALWRLFLVNLRQFIHILVVLYSIVLIKFMARSLWLIFLLLRKVNWVMCLIFHFWLLMLLFLFFLVKMVEVLIWFPA